MCESPWGIKLPLALGVLLPWAGDLCRLPDSWCPVVCTDTVGLWGPWNQEIPSLPALFVLRAPQWQGRGTELSSPPRGHLRPLSEVFLIPGNQGRLLLGGLLGAPPGSSPSPPAGAPGRDICALWPRRSAVTRNPRPLPLLSLFLLLSSDGVGAGAQGDHQGLLGAGLCAAVRPPDLLFRPPL